MITGVMPAHFRLVADWYALETGFAFGILPRNVEHVRPDCARYYSQPLQLIVSGGHYFPVNPGLVREDDVLFRPHLTQCLKLDMSLRRAAAGSFLGFQEDCQNLDNLKCVVGGVGQVQKNMRLSHNKSNCNRFFSSTNHFFFFLVCRLLSPFLPFDRASTSPVCQFSASQS